MDAYMHACTKIARVAQVLKRCNCLRFSAYRATVWLYKLGPSVYGFDLTTVFLFENLPLLIVLSNYHFQRA